MKLTLEQLRKEIRNALNEYGAPKGKLRKPGQNSGSRVQYKIGFTPDDNRELSAFDANRIFKGSVDAWCEVANEFSDEFSTDPVVVRKRSAFFQIADKLRVALERAPAHEIAQWEPTMGEPGEGDWIDV